MLKIDSADNSSINFSTKARLGYKYDIQMEKFNFLNFCDSKFSNLSLCSKPNSEIVNFTKLLVLESTEHSKPPNSLVRNDDPSRLKYDELQS